MSVIPPSTSYYQTRTDETTNQPNNKLLQIEPPYVADIPHPNNSITDLTVPPPKPQRVKSLRDDKSVKPPITSMNTGDTSLVDLSNDDSSHQSGDTISSQNIGPDDMISERPPAEPKGVVVLDSTTMTIVFLEIPHAPKIANRETASTVGTIIRSVVNLDASHNYGTKMRAEFQRIATIQDKIDRRPVNFNNMRSPITLSNTWDDKYDPFINIKDTRLSKEQLQDIYFEITGRESFDISWFNRHDVVHMVDLMTKFLAASTGIRGNQNSDLLSFQYYASILALRNYHQPTYYRQTDSYSTCRWIAAIIDTTNALFNMSATLSPYLQYIETVEDSVTGLLGEGLLLNQTEHWPHNDSQSFDDHAALPVNIQAWVEWRSFLIGFNADETRITKSVTYLMDKILPRYSVPYILQPDSITNRNVSMVDVRFMATVQIITSVLRP